MLAFGIALFALGIILSILLHEYGHYRVALWCGMRVRRFFVGFGPTLFSWNRGGTEYGLKGIPLGGFCDIAGMTAYDELDPEDEPRAMYRKPAWQRIAVLLAGPSMNFLIALVMFFGIAVMWGLPNLDRDEIPYPAVVAETTCVGGSECADGGPATAAGIEEGDRVTSIDGIAVDEWWTMVNVVSDRPGETVPVTVQRDGAQIDLTVTLGSVVSGIDEEGAIGIRLDTTAMSEAEFEQLIDDPRYRPIDPHTWASAVPGSVAFTGEMLRLTGEAIIELPGKVPGVVASIFGADRAEDSPMSVVGASHVGGQVVEREMWSSFFLLLASLNLFIGAFNLIPLTPFDGGHIAVVLYEKIRDALRRARGLSPGGPADYEKLMPLTMAVFVVLIGLSVIVITADVVNPILLP